jgi:hypothetical protein
MHFWRFYEYLVGDVLMQTFRDSVTGNVWAFNPDVVVTNAAGIYSFKTAAGVALNPPTTLQPYVVPAPPGPTLTQQAATAMASSYIITSPALGLTGVPFAIDAASQSHMQAEMIALLNSGGATFADGSTTLVWPDAASPPVNHTFAPPQAKTLFLTVISYVAALYKCQNGTLGALPTNPVVIA